MNAVRKGVKFARGSSPKIDQLLQDLVDVGQKRIMGTPGLYPLNPAAKSGGTGNGHRMAKELIKLCACYTLEPSGLTETRAEESESMRHTDTTTVPRPKSGQSSQYSLTSTTVNAACPARVNSKKMKYSR